MPHAESLFMGDQKFQDRKTGRQQTVAVLPARSQSVVGAEQQRQAEITRTVAAIRDVFNRQIYGKTTLSGIKKDPQARAMINKLFAIARPAEYERVTGSKPPPFPELEGLKSYLRYAQWLGQKISRKLRAVPKPVGEVYETVPTVYSPRASEGGSRDRKGLDLTPRTVQRYLRSYEKARAAGREYVFLQNKKYYVAISMDELFQDKRGSPLPYGTFVRVPELEKVVNAQRKKEGVPPVPYIRCRIVDSGDAFKGRETDRIDVCVDIKCQESFASAIGAYTDPKKWTFFRI